MTGRGRLITLEGGEGAGKSTQIGRLAASLAAAGVEILVTREPGGTPGAEAIRRLLVGGAPERWLPLSETLLILAARHDHVMRRIEPALAEGRWILCDRFSDSTRVYQGLAGGVGLAVVDRLHESVFGALRPDLTLILDLPVELGLRRRRRAPGANRFERKERAFHEQVRAGFLDLARAEPERCVVVDAARPALEVAGAIRGIVAARFALELEDQG
ncbi:MAG: dTMP kinase [Geminicoccaceae bacterium]